MPTQVLQGVIRVEPEPAPLSRLDFRWRLSLEEQRALRRAERDHPDKNTRDDLAIMRESLSEVTDASGVKVDDPRTQGGAALIVSVLVWAGLVTEANAPARLAALLTPPA
jgi:hypothetical protein